MYPWNNFLQLKVINICNEIITGQHDQYIRQNFLENSGIAQTFAEMAQSASIQMESGRNIRNGYMAVVISVSTKL